MKNRISMDSAAGKLFEQSLIVFILIPRKILTILIATFDKDYYL